MNRIMRSCLSGIALVLLLPVVLMGCSSGCAYCGMFCLILMSGAPSGQNLLYAMACFCTVCRPCCDLSPMAAYQDCADNPGECAATLEQYQTAATQFCEENPDDCAATWEEMQLAAIEFCEEHPAECQEAFDTWVEASEEEATE